MEFFKETKIVDASGNLQVMYHGSPQSFTVFDRKKAKSSGLYGKGFYFTTSDTHAGTYGNAYEVYLNIKNPLSETSGEKTFTREQIRRFVEAVAENEDDYGIDNYGYGATVDGITEDLLGKLE